MNRRGWLQALAVSVSATMLIGTVSAATQRPICCGYKFKAGETIRYEVTQVAKTKTRLKGNEEVSQAHTTSEKYGTFLNLSRQSK